MTLREFCLTYRVKPSKVEGEWLVRGKFGEVYDNEDGLFGILFWNPNGISDTTLDETIRSRVRRSAKEEGCELFCDADSEGIVRFVPENAPVVKKLLTLAGVKRVRRASLGQLENLRKGPIEEPVLA